MNMGAVVSLNIVDAFVSKSQFIQTVIRENGCEKRILMSMQATHMRKRWEGKKKRKQTLVSGLSAALLRVTFSSAVYRSRF